MQTEDTIVEVYGNFLPSSPPVDLSKNQSSLDWFQNRIGILEKSCELMKDVRKVEKQQIHMNRNLVTMFIFMVIIWIITNAVYITLFFYGLKK